MAAVTDPRAVSFANTRVRPMNDLLDTVYWSAKAFLQQWSSQGMGTLIPFTTDLIVDGSSVDGTDATGGDGRPLLTCEAAEQVYNLASTLVNVFERGTVDTSGTQNYANLNNVMSINVNGHSIF